MGGEPHLCPAATYALHGAGARAAGIDSALVCAGVHAAELGLRAQGTTEAPTTAALAAFLRGFAPEQRPTHVIPAFVM